MMTTIRQGTNIRYIEDAPTDTLDAQANDIYNRAAWLGLAAGMRSMTPGAALAWTDDKTPKALKILTATLAVGEFIGDKLPTTPSRLSTGPFVGRLATGAICGALLCRRYNKPILEGALRGLIGAAVGAVGGNIYRTLTSQATDIPDVLLAGIEDGLAVTLALKATQDEAHKVEAL